MEMLGKKKLVNNFKDLGNLLKNSITVIGKDEDIKTPIIRMSIFSVILSTIFILSLSLIFSGTSPVTGFLMIFLTIFILVPYSFFFYTKEKAAESWIVYNTITGKNISYDDAKQHIKQEKGKLRTIAFIDILIAYMKNQKKEKSGITAILFNLFIGALAEVWDLLSHYMIPAVVIEQKAIKELIPTLKAMKNNIPGALMGVFGLDFAGGAMSQFLIIAYLPIILISFGISYLIGLFTEATIFQLAGINFSWIPLVVGLYIIVIIGTVYNKFVEGIKVIYFTIFYTSLVRAKEIFPDMRTELTHYLMLEDVEISATPSNNDFKESLTAEVKHYLEQGYNKEQLRTYLEQKGYDKKTLDEVFRKI